MKKYILFLIFSFFFGVAAFGQFTIGSSAAGDKICAAADNGDKLPFTFWVDPASKDDSELYTWSGFPEHWDVRDATTTGLRDTIIVDVSYNDTARATSITVKVDGEDVKYGEKTFKVIQRAPKLGYADGGLGRTVTVTNADGSNSRIYCNTGQNTFTLSGAQIDTNYGDGPLKYRITDQNGSLIATNLSSPTYEKGIPTRTGVTEVRMAAYTCEATYELTISEDRYAKSATLYPIDSMIFPDSIMINFIVSDGKGGWVVDTLAPICTYYGDDVVLPKNRMAGVMNADGFIRLQVTPINKDIEDADKKLKDLSYEWDFDNEQLEEDVSVFGTNKYRIAFKVLEETQADISISVKTTCAQCKTKTNNIFESKTFTTKGRTNANINIANKEDYDFKISGPATACIETESVYQYASVGTPKYGGVSQFVWEVEWENGVVEGAHAVFEKTEGSRDSAELHILPETLQNKTSLFEKLPVKLYAANRCFMNRDDDKYFRIDTIRVSRNPFGPHVFNTENQAINPTDTISVCLSGKTYEQLFLKAVKNDSLVSGAGGLSIYTIAGEYVEDNELDLLQVANPVRVKNDSINFRIRKLAETVSFGDAESFFISVNNVCGRGDSVQLNVKFIDTIAAVDVKMLDEYQSDMDEIELNQCLGTAVKFRANIAEETEKYVDTCIWGFPGVGDPNPSSNGSWTVGDSDGFKRLDKEIPLVIDSLRGVVRFQTANKCGRSSFAATDTINPLYIRPLEKVDTLWNTYACGGYSEELRVYSFIPQIDVSKYTVSFPSDWGILDAENNEDNPQVFSLEDADSEDGLIYFKVRMGDTKTGNISVEMEIEACPDMASSTDETALIEVERPGKPQSDPDRNFSWSMEPGYVGYVVIADTAVWVVKADDDDENDPDTYIYRWVIPGTVDSLSFDEGLNAKGDSLRFAPKKDDLEAGIKDSIGVYAYCNLCEDGFYGDTTYFVFTYVDGVTIPDTALFDNRNPLDSSLNLHPCAGSIVAYAVDTSFLENGTLPIDSLVWILNDVEYSPASEISDGGQIGTTGWYFRDVSKFPDSLVLEVGAGELELAVRTIGPRGIGMPLERSIVPKVSLAGTTFIDLDKSNTACDGDTLAVNIEFDPDESQYYGINSYLLYHPWLADETKPDTISASDIDADNYSAYFKIEKITATAGQIWAVPSNGCAEDLGFNKVDTSDVAPKYIRLLEKMDTAWSPYACGDYSEELRLYQFKAQEEVNNYTVSFDNDWRIIDESDDSEVTFLDFVLSDADSETGLISFAVKMGAETEGKLFVKMEIGESCPDTPAAEDTTTLIAVTRPMAPQSDPDCSDLSSGWTKSEALRYAGFILLEDTLSWAVIADETDLGDSTGDYTFHWILPETIASLTLEEGENESGAALRFTTITDPDDPNAAAEGEQDSIGVYAQCKLCEEGYYSDTTYYVFTFLAGVSIPDTALFDNRNPADSVLNLTPCEGSIVAYSVDTSLLELPVDSLIWNLGNTRYTLENLETLSPGDLIGGTDWEFVGYNTDSILLAVGQQQLDLKVRTKGDRGEGKPLEKSITPKHLVSGATTLTLLNQNDVVCHEDTIAVRVAFTPNPPDVDYGITSYLWYHPWLAADSVPDTVKMPEVEDEDFDLTYFKIAKVDTAAGKIWAVPMNGCVTEKQAPIDVDTLLNVAPRYIRPLEKVEGAWSPYACGSYDDPRIYSFKTQAGVNDYRLSFSESMDWKFIDEKNADAEVSSLEFELTDAMDGKIDFKVKMGEDLAGKIFVEMKIGDACPSTSTSTDTTVLIEVTRPAKPQPDAKRGFKWDTASTYIGYVTIGEEVVWAVKAAAENKEDAASYTYHWILPKTLTDLGFDLGLNSKGDSLHFKPKESPDTDAPVAGDQGSIAVYAYCQLCEDGFYGDTAYFNYTYVSGLSIPDTALFDGRNPSDSLLNLNPCEGTEVAYFVDESFDTEGKIESLLWEAGGSEDASLVNLSDPGLAGETLIGTSDWTYVKTDNDSIILRVGQDVLELKVRTVGVGGAGSEGKPIELRLTPRRYLAGTASLALFDTLCQGDSLRGEVKFTGAEEEVYYGLSSYLLYHPWLSTADPDTVAVLDTEENEFYSGVFSIAKVGDLSSSDQIWAVPLNGCTLDPEPDPSPITVDTLDIAPLFWASPEHPFPFDFAYGNTTDAVVADSLCKYRNKSFSVVRNSNLSADDSLVYNWFIYTEGDGFTVVSNDSTYSFLLEEETYSMPADSFFVSARYAKCKTFGDSLVVKVHLLDTIPAADLGSILVFDELANDYVAVSNLTPCPRDSIYVAVENKVGFGFYRWNLPSDWSFADSAARYDDTVKVVVGFEKGVLRVAPITDTNDRFCGADLFPNAGIITDTVRPRESLTATGVQWLDSSHFLCPSGDQNFKVLTNAENPSDIHNYMWRVPQGWTIDTLGTAAVAINDTTFMFASTYDSVNIAIDADYPIPDDVRKVGRVEVALKGECPRVAIPEDYYWFSIEVAQTTKAQGLSFVDELFTPCAGDSGTLGSIIPIQAIDSFAVAYYSSLSVDDTTFFSTNVVPELPRLHGAYDTLFVIISTTNACFPDPDDALDTIIPVVADNSAVIEGVILGRDTICVGSLHRYTARTTNATRSAIFSNWSLKSSGSDSITVINDSTIEISFPLNDGVAYVDTLTVDAQACGFGSFSLPLVVGELETISESITEYSTPCDSTNCTFEIVEDASLDGKNAVYSWEAPAGWKVVGDSTKSEITFLIIHQTGAEDYIKVKRKYDGSCGYGNVKEHLVEVKAKPEVPSFVGDVIPCKNSPVKLVLKADENRDYTGSDWFSIEPDVYDCYAEADTLFINSVEVDPFVITLKAKSDLCPNYLVTADTTITPITSIPGFAPEDSIFASRFCLGDSVYVEIPWTAEYIDAAATAFWTLPESWDSLQEVYIDSIDRLRLYVLVGNETGEISVKTAALCGPKDDSLVRAATPITVTIPSIKALDLDQFASQEEFPYKSWSLLEVETPVSSDDGHDLGFDYSWTPRERYLDQYFEGSFQLGSIETKPLIYAEETFHVLVQEIVVEGVGCIAEDSITVKVSNPFAVEAKGKVDICPNDSIRLLLVNSEKDDSTVYYEWYQFDGANYAKLTTPYDTLKELIMSLDSETLSLMVVGYDTLGTQGFVVSDSVFLDLRRNPEITNVIVPHPADDMKLSGKTITMNIGDKLSLESEADGGAGDFSYSWEPAQYFGHLEVESPEPTSLALFYPTTIYSIVEDTNGCLGIDSLMVNPTHDFGSVPNTFTPNGDGINDLFMEGVSLIILNRWGVELFRSKNGEGWDGTSKGKPVDKGEYIYIISVIGENKIEYVKKGTVTVL